ncbi:MAG: toll/interleukin-1 receptor domain-containing protein [Hyphomicrobiales bacterium]|nr:MAG: toll/interleukin-1 receptor domain-containing protein [Hyphomicrobiales bacterium]
MTAELIEAGVIATSTLLALIGGASVVAREKLISLYRLDRRVRAWGLSVLIASVILLLIVSLFAFHIPTTPLWPLSTGWRLKGFACAPEALQLPELRDNCPFLGLPELAMANYEAGMLWTAPSRFAVSTVFVASLMMVAIGLTMIIGLQLARRRKLLRWSALSRRVADPHSQRGGNIFISYRRADTASEASALAGQLSSFFEVFLDTQRLPAGVDFVEEIRVAIRQAEAVFVLIGPNWSDASDPNAKSGLFDPNDYVRLEVRTALGLDIPIIPVLVRGARMPSASKLPADIASFARKNAFMVPDDDLAAATHRLLDFIARGQMAI